MRLPRLLAAVGLLIGVAMLPALALKTKPKTGFVDKTFKNADGTKSPYVVFVPHDYDGTKEYPVILFLHGAGETKNRRRRRKRRCRSRSASARRSRSARRRSRSSSSSRRPRGFGWGADTRRTASGRSAMLDEVMKEYKTDPKRHVPDRPVDGRHRHLEHRRGAPGQVGRDRPDLRPRRHRRRPRRSRTSRAGASTATRTRAVKVDGSRDMIEAIKKAGGKPKYTEYPGVGHNSWDKAYGTDELYKWLLEAEEEVTRLQCSFVIATADSRLLERYHDLNFTIPSENSPMSKSVNRRAFLAGTAAAGAAMTPARRQLRPRPRRQREAPHRLPRRRRPLPAAHRRHPADAEGEASGRSPSPSATSGTATSSSGSQQGPRPVPLGQALRPRTRTTRTTSPRTTARSSSRRTSTSSCIATPGPLARQDGHRRHGRRQGRLHAKSR